jgi:tetratricopeptide (TPR) repeat protein/transcriptional regulator with XRE-family HTH domain
VFGEAVRGHRHRLGLTQEELAERTGLSIRGLRKIEAGQVAAPRPVTVRLLAEVLGLAGEDRDRFVTLASTRPAGRAVPAQLAVDVAAFTGRRAELAHLDRMLSGRERRDAPAIIAVSGTAGVGKTALAIRWAHRVRGRFPDGQLYVNLRAYDPGMPMTAGDALARFLRGLGVADSDIPLDVEERAARYRGEVAGRRVLVVLDNAGTAEQVRPLLPGTPTAVTVVTSRSQLTSLVAADGADVLTLDVLTPAGARELLARRLGPDQVARQPVAVEEIAARCARLPLALTIAAARAVQTGFPLAALAAELAEADRCLDALDAGDTRTQVRAVFSWSYTSLTRPAARLFRLLGVHPGPDISAAAAASLAGCPVAEARLLLTELARASLLAEHTPGRYAFHDLLRAYAADLAEPPDSPAALVRMLDHYLHSACAADRHIDPLRDPITLGPAAAGVVAEAPVDRAAALEWFGAELPALLAAAQLAADTGADPYSWQLPWALVSLLEVNGRLHDGITTQESALAAARRAGDRGVQAMTHRLLGRAYQRLTHNESARGHLERAADLYAAVGDDNGRAHAYIGLAAVERQSCGAVALALSEQALALYRATGHRPGQANALNQIGWHLTLHGDHRTAVTYCTESVALLRALGDRRNEANALDSLAHAYHHLGEHGPAMDCYRQALDLYRAGGYRYREAETSRHIGDAHLAHGDPDAAHAAWQHALRILDDLDHPDAATLRSLLRPDQRDCRGRIVHL